MAGDATFSNVSTLLNCHGTNGSTAIVDNSSRPKVWTANGNAKISTAISVFGSPVIALDGSGDYLSAPHHTDFSAVGVDFWIEAFIYVIAHTAGNAIIINKDGVAGASYSQYDLSITSGGKLTAFLGNGNGVSLTGTTYTGATTITTGVVHHVALGIGGSTCYGFLDGTVQWSAAAATRYEGSKPLLVGYQTGQPSTAYLNGYVYGVRIKKGECLRTAAFTPPTGPHPEGDFSVDGVIRDDAGLPCARTVRLIHRGTGALIGSVVSNATTGAYTIGTDNAEEVCRIVHDDTAGTLYNDLIDRVIPA